MVGTGAAGLVGPGASGGVGNGWFPRSTRNVLEASPPMSLPGRSSWSSRSWAMCGSRGREFNDAYAALLDHPVSAPPASTLGAEPRERCLRERSLPSPGCHRPGSHPAGQPGFNTAGSYANFVGVIVRRRNLLAQGKLEQERTDLRPLPPDPMSEYVNYRASGAPCRH